MRTSVYKALPVFLFVAVCFCYEAIAQLPFTDGFESGNFITGGWTVSGGAQISTANPSQGLYCTQGVAAWGLLKSIPSVSDSIVFVEFDVRASQTNTNCLVFRIRDNNMGTSAGFFLNNLGQVMGVNGPTPPVVLTNYTINQWYKILFELNMNSATYNIYIDGIPVANNFNFYSSSFGMPADFSWSSVAASGSAWIDGVTIYGGVATGLNGKSKPNKNVVLFPNPVKQTLNIQSDITKDCIISIYNPHGEKVLSQTLNKDRHSVEVSHIADGLYFLNISDKKGNTLYSGKIVKH